MSDHAYRTTCCPYCVTCKTYWEIQVDKLCPICANVLDILETIVPDDEAPTPVDWGFERKETVHYDKPKTGTKSSSVPAPKSVLSDEEFDKLVTQHSMPSLADIYKKGLKQNVLRPIEAYAHKN